MIHPSPNRLELKLLKPRRRRNRLCDILGIADIRHVDAVGHAGDVEVQGLFVGVGAREVRCSSISFWMC